MLFLLFWFAALALAFADAGYCYYVVSKDISYEIVDYNRFYHKMELCAVASVLCALGFIFDIIRLRYGFL